MENELILHKLNQIEKHVSSLKNVLTVQELVEYTGFKQSYVYKLVHKNEIPYSKPSGGRLFFSRESIDEWLLSSKHKSNSELDQEAINYAFKKRKK